MARVDGGEVAGHAIDDAPRVGVVGYRYRLDGEEVLFAPDEIIVLREFSTSSRFGGMGRLHAGRQEVLTDLRARKWNDELLKRGVHVSGTLEAETEDLTPQKAKMIQRSFMKQYGGASKAARVAVLWGGLKFRPQTLAHKDIFWAEQLRMTKEDIAAAFGVPEELLGAKSANFAALREKRRIFWEDTVKSYTTRIASVINSSFLPRVAPDLICWFDFSNVDALAEDRTEQVKAGEIAIRSGQYTLNEWRQRVLGLDPVPGGDVLFIGRGLVPLETAIAGEAGSRSADRLPALARARHELRSVVGVEEKARDDWMRTISKIRQDTETRLQNIIRDYFTTVERKIAGEAATSAEEIVSRAHVIMLGEDRQVIAAKADSTLRRAAEKAGSEAFAAVGIEASFTIRNTAAERVLAGQKRRIRDIGNRKWTELRRVLLDQLAAGSSEDMMRDAVREFFRGERANALTIARTETAPAINSATYSAQVEAIRMGIPVKSEWNTVLDDVTRTGKYDHASAHGLTIDPSTEMFRVSGEALRFPGDFENGSPGNTINCRCAIRPVVSLKAADENRPRSEQMEGGNAVGS